ncbi:MAG: stage 0 sporulation family protein [Thermodesulfobacteriota bacterium]|nr:stage 0 sporulation family protein [Thermodesulfobacteriota bacterium]
MPTQNKTDEPAQNNDEKTIVTVKFRSAGKQYYFDSNGFDLSLNDEVVVETNRGRALGTVIKQPRQVATANLPSDLKNVLRLATKADHNMARISASKETEAYDYCFSRIHHRKMTMKLVKAEYLFDGSKIIFYFTADGRVDFRELVKDLAQYFHTRIEMRQIGVRDEAKLIGGIGICGRELCCGTFLTNFHPVSVRMAKQQGLALNPTKISGQCGRLLCCLGYEYDTYCSMSKQLPKPGTRITLDGKTADILSSQTLAQTVTVRSEGKVITNIPLAELSNRKCSQCKSSDAQLVQPTTSAKNEKPTTEQHKSNKTGIKNKKRGDNRHNKPTKSGNPAVRKNTTEKPAQKSGEQRKKEQRTGERPNRNRPSNTRSHRRVKPTQTVTDKTQTNRQDNTHKPSQEIHQPQNQTKNPDESNNNKPKNKTAKRRSRNRRRPPRKP